MTTVARTTVARTTVARTPAKSAPFRLEGRHVIGAFVAFFAIVFATNVVMVWLAVSTFGGLETADAYRKGIEYNRTLAAASAQERLGWAETIKLADGQQLEVTIRDRAGQGIDGLTASARLGRPATGADDRRLDLTGAGNGRYTAAVAALAAGSWIVSIEAADPSRGAAGSAAGPVVFRAKARVWNQP